MLALIFKLIQSAEKNRRPIKGFPPIDKVIPGVVFTDGVRTSDHPAEKPPDFFLIHQM
jgi:hypothetical protein